MLPPYLVRMAPRPFKVSLWDVDNCVSDDKWRAHKIDWHLTGSERFNRYDAEMSKDSVAHTSEWRIVTELSAPIFITGRRERWRGMTREWIIRQLPIQRGGRLVWQTDPIILMRPEGCDLHPAELKEMLLCKVFQMGVLCGDILAAFDDVQSIVDMYRSHGIPASVLQVHDPRLTYAPQDL